MKILTDLEYKALLLHKEGNEFRIKQIEDLKQELREARDMKEILKSLSKDNNDFLTALSGFTYVNSIGDSVLSLSDDVLVYVDDILGGKVIKQEGNKCLVIDKTGNVKTGLTKEKPDKGYAYKLIRKTN